MTTDDRNLTLRTLDVLELLCGFAATGASNSDLAGAANTTATHITRCMAQLVAKGWARKDEGNGRFYPTAHITKLAFTVLTDFENAARRLADSKHNFTNGY